MQGRVYDVVGDLLTLNGVKLERLPRTPCSTQPVSGPPRADLA